LRRSGTFRWKAATPAAGKRLTRVGTRSETAPIGWDPVIAMQLGFLRTIAPVKILVGMERRRPLQLFVSDVEHVGFELGVVGKTGPRQRQQAGSDAEEAAEAENRIGNPARNLVDHQPFDMAE